MKTTTITPCLLAGLLLALPAQANLLVNGDFNTGDLTGWWTYAPDPVNQGMWATNVAGFAPDNSPYAYEWTRNSTADSVLGQNVSVAAGSEYQVSLNYRGNNWGGAGVGIWYYNADYSSQVGYEWVTLYSGNGTDTGWLSLTSPIWTAPAQTAWVSVRLDAWGWSDTYYDNVVLTVIPEPGSLAFMAAGGLALLVLRRRRA